LQSSQNLATGALGHIIRMLINQPQRMITCVDLCGGPGSFVELFLALFGSRVRLCGITKEDPNLMYNFGSWSQPPKTFHYMYGDVTDPSVAVAFERMVTQLPTDHHHPHSVQLVTADGGFDLAGKEGEQDVTTAALILSECVLALRLMDQGGWFVVKVFDIHHPWLVLVLQLVGACFQSQMVTKPIQSRPTSSERYVVFAYAKDTKDADRVRATTHLEQTNNRLHQRMKSRSLHGPTEDDLQACMPDVALQDSWFDFLKQVNDTLCRAQNNSLGHMVHLCTQLALRGTTNATKHKEWEWTEPWLNDRTLLISDTIVTYIRNLDLHSKHAKGRHPLHDGWNVRTCLSLNDAIREMTGYPSYVVKLIKKQAQLYTFFSVSNQMTWTDVPDAHKTKQDVKMRSGAFLREAGSFECVASTRQGSKPPAESLIAQMLVSWLDSIFPCGVCLDIAVDVASKTVSVIDIWNIPYQGSLVHLTHEERTQILQTHLTLWLGAARNEWSVIIPHSWVFESEAQMRTWFRQTTKDCKRTQALWAKQLSLLVVPDQRQPQVEEKNCLVEDAVRGGQRFATARWGCLLHTKSLCIQPCCMKSRHASSHTQ